MNEIQKLTRQNAEENAAHENAMEEINNNGWQDVYQSLLADLASEDLAAVSKFHHAGTVVADLKANYDSATYRRMLNLFSRTKKLNARILTAAFKFYQEMGEYVQDITELYNESQDYRVNQSHLQRVMVDYLTPEDRFEYLRRAVAEGLSADKMYKLIQSENGRQGGTGRSFAQLETREQVLLQMQEVLGKVIRVDEQSWRKAGAPAILLLENTEAVDEVLRSELDATLEVICAVRDLCQTLIPTFVSLQGKYLTSYLDAQPAVQTAEVSTGSLRGVMRSDAADTVRTMAYED